MMSPPTPPVEELGDGPDSCELWMENMLVPTTLPRWKCEGKFSNIVSWSRLPDSVLSQGEVERLLSGERPVPQLSCMDGIELWGIRTGLVMDQVHQVSSVMCHYLGILETIGCNAGGHTAFPGVTLDLEDIEWKVARCLAFLKELGYQGKKDKLNCDSLEEVIRDILLFMGKITDLPVHIIAQPAASRYFHTWLEVRWTLISLCFLTEDTTKANNSLLDIPLAGNSWLEKLLAATMIDLVEVAAKRMKSMTITFKNITKISIFNCPCIEELWYSLFTICQQKDINFWSLLSCCCKEGSTSKESLESDILILSYFPENHDIFLEPMLLSSLLSLLNASGFAFDKPMKDKIFKSIKVTLKAFLGTMELDCNESKLRTFLAVHSSVFCIIGPSLDILDELWKFFSQISRLNSACRLKVMTMEGSTSIPATSTAWLNQVQSLSSVKDPTSFLMFVQLAEQSLQWWNNNCEPGQPAKESKIFISRISLKLNAKKIVVLNEYGVYHLGSLMLTLCSVQPENQTPATILLQILELVKQTQSSRLTSLKCCLAYCILMVESGLSINKGGLGEAAIKCVGDAVTMFATNQSEVEKKRIAQDNIKIFVGTLEDITDQSVGLTSDEDILIQQWLGVYLSICSVNEIATICTALNNLLTRARILLNTCPGDLMITSEQVSDKAKLVQLLTKLWDIVYPAMKSLCTSLTAPTQVSSLAADFVILSAENKTRGGQNLVRESVEDMIRYFCLNKLVTSNIAASFLGRIVHNKAVLDQVIAETGSHKILLEVLAVVCVHTGVCSNNHQIVRKTWLHLAPILGLQENSQDKEQDLAMEMMEKLMNSNYTDVLNCMAKECSDVSKWKDDQLRMYQVAGWLVKDCSHVLYKPGGADPTFTNVIGNLLTPSLSFSSTWILSGKQKQGLLNSLPDFIIGLTSCSKLKSDKFIVRKITEIIRIYLPRFDIAHHPLLPLLSSPVIKASGENVETIQQLAVAVIIKMIQDNRFKNPGISSTCLKYFNACMTKPCGKSFSLISKELLSTLLEILTLTDDKLLKNPAISLLHLIITHPDNDTEMVKEKLKSFLAANLAFNSERVFQSLIVLSVMKGTMISDIFPQIEIEVAKIETKRGSGRDPKLRKLLENLKSRL